jgi:hypothetical protein
MWIHETLDATATAHTTMDRNVSEELRKINELIN